MAPEATFEEPLTANGAEPANGQGKVQDAAQGGEGEEAEAPWIRYCFEVVDAYNYCIATEQSRVSIEEARGKSTRTAKKEAEMPIFDVVESIQDRRNDGAVGASSGSQSSWSLRIHSPQILNALRSVVQYYPSQSLAETSVVVAWPYAVLCHHYDQLLEFKNRCRAKNSTQLCVRERGAAIHLEALLGWLDDNVMFHVRAEIERNQRNAYTWKWAWVWLRPGSTVLCRSVVDPVPRAYVLKSVSSGVLDGNSPDYRITTWSMAWNGTVFQRLENATLLSAFDGERNCNHTLEEDEDAVYSSMRVLTEEELADPDALEEGIQSLIRAGTEYWKATSRVVRWYRGKGADAPYNDINALVMIDSGVYYTEFPYHTPVVLDEADLRIYHTDCRCANCRVENNTEMKAPFATYLAISPQDPPTWHQKMLFPPTIPGFVFRTRTWEQLWVGRLKEPDFDTKLFKNLVMDEDQKQRLLALINSYSRVNKAGATIERPTWSADFVKGKGQGLIFLLHGSPGVGKTCTAECIAEFLERPLMVLTSSDIGTDPVQVEANLTREFKEAKSWNAVLLIDEADVFMEQRSARDLTRNSLVAGFLRALEFYDGILFLTTNRVGTFDDAFISRIHIKLYYHDFTPAQRLQIWELFIAKLHRENGKFIRVNAAAKEYLRSSKLTSLEWNGREIRNAFQTAVALAEYYDEKDEDGKVVVTDDHLSAVASLSNDFDEYLNQLHKKKMAARAELRHERLEMVESLPEFEQ